MIFGRDIFMTGFESGKNRLEAVCGQLLTPPYIFLIYRNLGNLTDFHPPTYLCRSKADLYFTAPSMAGTVSPCVRLTGSFHI